MSNQRMMTVKVPYQQGSGSPFMTAYVYPRMGPPYNISGGRHAVRKHMDTWHGPSSPALVFETQFWLLFGYRKIRYTDVYFIGLPFKIITRRHSSDGQVYPGKHHLIVMPYDKNPRCYSDKISRLHTVLFSYRRLPKKFVEDWYTTARRIHTTEKHEHGE